jgi:hypothetical protein
MFLSTFTSKFIGKMRVWVEQEVSEGWSKGNSEPTPSNALGLCDVQQNSGQGIGNQLQMEINRKIERCATKKSWRVCRIAAIGHNHITCREKIRGIFSHLSS